MRAEAEALARMAADGLGGSIPFALERLDPLNCFGKPVSGGASIASVWTTE